MITCILLSDRHCGSGEIIFPKRWGQTKLCGGQLAQYANGRAPFVIMDVSFPNRCDRVLGPSGCVFKVGQGKKNGLWTGQGLTAWYHRACLGKRSWALLASNPARDNQVRAGRMIPRGPGGSLCRGQLLLPVAPPAHSFCPGIPPKTQVCGSMKAVLVPVSRQPRLQGSSS